MWQLSRKIVNVYKFIKNYLIFNLYNILYIFSVQITKKKEHPEGM